MILLCASTAAAAPAKKPAPVRPPPENRLATDKPKPIDITPVIDKVDVFKDDVGNFYVSPRPGTLAYEDAGAWVFFGDAKAMFFEGCLSVNGYVGLVERSLEVEVTGLDEHGAPVTWRARGWPARILQHEVDHLDGTLYVDRMATRSFCNAEEAKARFGGKPIAEVKHALGLDAAK